jgi:hypothetical protein
VVVMLLVVLLLVVLLLVVLLLLVLTPLPVCVRSVKPRSACDSIVVWNPRFSVRQSAPNRRLST